MNRSDICGYEKNEERLYKLKIRKFLTKRIFSRISENMHYEIFKNLNCRELLRIRALKLGGYQLTSNKILRSRIKNYFPKIDACFSLDPMTAKWKMHSKEGNAGIFGKAGLVARTVHKINLIFEQTGKYSLSFKRNALDSKGIAHISKLLKMIPQTRQITINSNKTRQIEKVEGIKSFGQNLKYVRKLQSLKLKHLRLIIPDEYRILFRNFKWTSNLRQLDLSGAELLDTAIAALCQNLKLIKKLISLNLSGNLQIGDQELIYLGEHLRFIPRLLNLQLENCSYGEMGMMFFAVHLKWVPKLQCLNFSGNQIGDDGLDYLAQNIDSIPKLVSLNLKSIEFEEVSIARFLEKLTMIITNEFWLSIDSEIKNISPLITLA